MVNIRVEQAGHSEIHKMPQSNRMHSTRPLPGTADGEQEIQAGLREYYDPLELEPLQNGEEADSQIASQ